MGSGPQGKTIRFRDLEISIPPGVYPPSDDTYLLAENLRVGDGWEVLELGCGCGLLSLLAAEKAKRVVTTDINPEALRATVINAERNGLGGKVETRLGDLFASVKGGERFDLIIFNPPYLPLDSNEKDTPLVKAWSGGLTGREVTERFLSQLSNFLKPGGKALTILSTLSGGEEILKTAPSRGLSVVVVEERAFHFERIFLVRLERAKKTKLRPAEYNG